MPILTGAGDGATTPGREIRVVFDDHPPQIVQPYIFLGRSHQDMARGSDSAKSSVMHLPGIGWRLTAKQWRYGSIRESSDGQGGLLSLTTSAGVVSGPTEGRRGLTGLTYDADVPTSGMTAYRKGVKAGSSWDSNLSTEQTAWPEPTSGPSFPVQIDRIARTNSTYTPGPDWHFAWRSESRPRPIELVFHFAGPGGTSGPDAQHPTGFAGDGRYSIMLDGFGRWWLAERGQPVGGGSDQDKIRAQGRWAASAMIPNCWHELHIATNYRPSGTARRPVLLITFSSIEEPSADAQRSSGGYGQSILVLQGRRAPQSQVIEHLYEVPLWKGATPVVPDEFAQVSQRRDARIPFQVAQSRYDEIGVLLDDVVDTGILPTTAQPYIFDVFWDKPTGTDVTVNLCRPDGTALTATGTPVSNAYGIRTSWVPVEREGQVRVKVQLEANAGRTLSPTITGWKLYRGEVADTPPLEPIIVPRRGDTTPSPWLTEAGTVQVSATQQRIDAPSATLELMDHTGELEVLRTRASIPVRIETTVPGETERLVLFRGFTSEINSRELSPRPHSSSGQHGYDRHRMSVSCQGEWVRLREAMTPRSLTWADQETGLGMKATDLIRILLNTAVPESRIDVPDLDQRLFIQESGPFLVRQFDPIETAIEDTAESYLAAVLVFDEGAGSSGKWRLRLPPTPPYNNVAVFERETSSSEKAPQHHPGLYPPVSGVPAWPILDSIQTVIERPEANYITVYAASGGSDNGESGAGGGIVGQTAIKVDSYNFLGLSSGHAFYPDGSSPDFLGRHVPMVVLDGAFMGTQDAVDWLTYRLYRASCFRRIRHTFMAPLPFVFDPSDTQQERPRRLLAYDPVLLRMPDGSLRQCIVKEADLIVESEEHQMARITVLYQEGIEDGFQMPPKPHATIRRLMEAAREAGGGNSAARVSFGQGDAARRFAGALSGLPFLGTEEFQILDPSSSNFGKFNAIAGLTLPQDEV
jgi:hypothetical protein